MTASVGLNLAERLGITIGTLQEGEQLHLFGIGEINTFTQEVFLELGEGQGLTSLAHLGQRKYLVEIDILRLAQTSHGLGVDEASQLESNMTFMLAIVLSVDSAQRLLVEVDNRRLVVDRHAFDSVVRDAADVLVTVLVDVSYQGRECFARREQATD